MSVIEAGFLIGFLIGFIFVPWVRIVLKDLRDRG